MANPKRSNKRPSKTSGRGTPPLAVPPQATPTVPTSASAWRETSQAATHLLQLPSGNAARVRRPGMEKFLSSGIMPDALSEEVRRMIKRAKGGAKINAKTVDLGDTDPLEMLRVLDRLFAYCVVEPEVRIHFRKVLNPDDPDGPKIEEDIPESEREDAVYTDWVDVEDKQFVFQFAVGGGSDLERFREEARLALDDLSAGEDVENTP